ncbi:MAG: hypothetical protein Q7K44_00870 [Candidatus Liptonbacteria bacterium]|nr:hypothetical protein [Candidatus Liptonbacteria bacterium]
MDNQSIEEGLEEISKLCENDHDLRIIACRLWKKDYGRTTPRMAIHSARRMQEMAEEQKHTSA